MDLKQYDLAALKAAAKHLAEVEARVGQDSHANPGPGWAPIIDILARDRAALVAEVTARIAAGGL